MRVAHNAVIDHLRKQRPARENLNNYVDVDEQAGSENEEAKFDQQIFKQQLQLAIQSLDDPFRSIIVMRDVQGLSYAEIRASLDLSESQVKVYLHRGRRKLRDNSNLRQLFETQINSGPAATKSIKPAAEQAANDKGSGHAR